MAKKTKRRKNRKWIYWMLIFVLLVVACIVGYFVWDSYFKDKDEKRDEVVEVVEEQNIDKDNNNEGEAVGLTTDVDDGKKIDQYDGANPNTAEELSGVVTYAGVNGDSLMIRVNIDQYVTNGKCELTLSKNGANIHSSIASIVGNASTATCEGFDIPASNLGGGNIKINIKLNADGKSGVIQGEVNI